MTSELLGLGLLDKADVQNESPDKPAYKNIMHGTSHHMGHPWLRNLDWTNASQYGFTVEPGIYIPAEGFGIRLEDDLVIQESGEPFNATFLLKRMKLKVWWTSPKGLLGLNENSLGQSKLFF
jgi:Xaa-Pro aminopeptidase